jgi:hypothetical protein
MLMRLQTMKNLLITLLLTSTVLFGQDKSLPEPNKIYFTVSPKTEIVYYSADPIKSAPSQAIKMTWEVFLQNYSSAYTWDKKANDGTFLFVNIEEHERTHKKSQPKVVMLPTHIPPVRNSHDTLIIVTPPISKPAIKDK